MKTLDAVKQHIEQLLSEPGRELGHWARFARFQLHLWRFCVRRLWANNVSAMSAALSFRTIFALIPIIVLAVVVLNAMGVLEDGKRSLRRILEGSGFAQIAIMEEATDTKAPPAEPGEVFNVADEIERAVESVEAKLSVGRIGPIGVALLVWTALELLTTMERSLNRIFGAPRARPLGRRVLLYWSVLTLGPLPLIAAVYAGRKAVQTFEGLPGAAWLLAAAGRVGPVIIGILLLAALYKFLPYTHVRYRSALGGALVSVPLWLVAKWGFSIYVSGVVRTGSLYGALGLLPLFLIWLNLSWSIFLFGAQLAHTATNLARLQIEERAARTELGPSDVLAAAVAMAESFLAERGAVPVGEIADRLQLPQESAQRLLDKLASVRAVCPVEGRAEPAYVLAKPPERIRILDILGANNLPAERAPARSYESEIAETVSRTWARTRSALGTFTLAQAIRAGEESTKQRDGHET